MLLGAIITAAVVAILAILFAIASNSQRSENPVCNDVERLCHDEEQYARFDDSYAQDGGITSDERLRDALRRHIQRAFDERRFNRATLAAESKVNIHSIDAILSRDSGKHRRVAGVDMLNLAYTLGDDAVQALNATIHYSARRLDHGLDLQPNEILPALLPHVTTIATATAAGRITHVDAPRCTDAADRIIAIVLPLSSNGAH